MLQGQPWCAMPTWCRSRRGGPRCRATPVGLGPVRGPGSGDAESPVYTSPQDFTLRVRRELLPPEARQAPTEFVRLINCLGYGKNALLAGVPDRANDGTFQFCTIFGRLAGTLPAPANAAATWRERVAWEVQTLLTLQAAGIWLLDA